MTNDSATLPVLITIPHSHYSEKARWALDRLELPYREEVHIPLLHRLATIRNGGGRFALRLFSQERIRPRAVA
jgi:glutathione S-transferase